MKPPVDAPTSMATRPVGIDPEGIERGEQLVRAPADPLAAGVDAERLGDIDEIARLPVGAR